MTQLDGGHQDTATTGYRILGPVELHQGRTPVPLGGPRQVALLAFLLVHANQAVSTDQLLEALWPPNARASPAKRVHVAVARLRKALATAGAADALQTLAGGYRLTTGAGELDADRFAAQIAAGRAAVRAEDHVVAVQALDATLALWRGPPLADVGYEDFAQGEIRRLHELRLAALEARANSRLALGDHAEVVTELEQVVAAHPTHERLVAQLMVALYRCGRQEDALETYQQARRHLISTLGLDPGPELERLQRAVLEHADDLAPPRAGAARSAMPAGARVPLPPLLDAASSRPFVGRVEERQRLEHCWEAALAGQRSIAVVAGEPGIGKTAISAAFARDVHAGGATVLYGNCEAQSVVPYHPLVTALRAHFRHARPPWSGGEWLADVAAVLGITGEQASSSQPVDGDRYRLFEGVRAVLERLAETRPVLMVLDDLHWAEPSTMMMIGHLAREADPARLMLLATYRDTDSEAGGPVHDLWSAPRVRPVDHVTLAALRSVDTADLVEERAGRAVTRHVADRWHDRSGGNPFFLDQLLADAAPDAITRGPAVNVPDGARDLIFHRVAGLSDASGSTLRAAAVIGTEFDLDLVRELTGLPDDVCLAALEEAIRSGLVVELTDHTDCFAFVHALVREALYEQQTQSRRVRAHARVVGVLEQAGAPAAEMAHHAFEARRFLGHERAVEHLTRAATGAVTALAYEDAAAHYQRALFALASAYTGTDHQRCELLLGLGEAQARAGQPDVDATFAEAVLSARGRGDADQFARAALAGRQSETGVRDDARIALLGEALAVLGDQRSTLRVEVLARRASVLHFAGEEEQAHSASAEALELAAELGDPRAEIAALHGRQGALMHIADLDERLDLLERLIELAERVGLPDFVALGREWTTYARLELGDLEQARREYEQFAAVAAVLRQPRFDHVELAWRAVFAQLDGRLDAAEGLAVAGRTYADRLHIADADSLFASQLCFIRRDQDRLHELLTMVGTNVSYAADVSWQAGLVIALAGAGEHRRAISALEAAGRHGFEDVPRDFWWLSRIALFAEGCALVGEAGVAGPLYRLLEPYADRHVQLVFAAHLGSVHRLLGLLSSVRGDGRRAIEHFEAAWERHEAAGAPALARRSTCELAGALVQRGGTGDRRRARRLLGQAVAGAAGTALEPLISRLARDAAVARARTS